MFDDEDFPKVPTDGSALIQFFEDLYVYHKGYWIMAKSDKFADFNVLDLTKPILYDEDNFEFGQMYSVDKAKWVFMNMGELEE